MRQHLPQRIGQAWPKAYRLRTRAEYLSVQRRGKRLTTADLVVLWRRGSSDVPRLGITVSRKVSKRAVRRNRLKRWLKESFRRLRLEQGPVVDLVVIAKRSALGRNQLELEAQLQKAWKLLGSE